MLVFTYVSSRLRHDHKGLIELSYFWIATVTTIGYGDISPKCEKTRAASIVIIPLSAYAMASFVGKYIEFCVERNAIKKQHNILERGIRESDLNHMDKDGNGIVSRLEFLEFMLLTMDKVDEDDLEQIHSQFDIMDRDNSGELTRDDIVAKIIDRKETLLSKENDRSLIDEARDIANDIDFDDPRAPLIL